MRLHGVIPFLAFASLPLFSPSTPALQREQGPTSAILRIEEQWLHAKTMQEVAQFLAPDFVGVSTRGIIETRAQRLARFRPSPQPPATAVHFEHMAIAFPASGVAIATGQVVATGSRDTPVYTVSFSDTFCRRQGRWLAVHAQETLASPRQ